MKTPPPCAMVTTEQQTTLRAWGRTVLFWHTAAHYVQAMKVSFRGRPAAAAWASGLGPGGFRGGGMGFCTIWDESWSTVLTYFCSMHDFDGYVCCKKCETLMVFNYFPILYYILCLLWLQFFSIPTYSLLQINFQIQWPITQVTLPFFR